MTVSDPGFREITDRITRRNLFRVIGGCVALSTVGATRNTAQQSTPNFGGWFDNVSNFSGIVDKTEQRQITVEVGTEANDGYFGYDPPAIRVSPGTTVVWEWTGEGGSHNVVSSSGTFESDLTNQAGHTYEHTFEKAGVYTYYCSPHKSLGMKGAIVVGDIEVRVQASASTTGGGEGEERAVRPGGGSITLERVSVQDALIVTMLGMSGLAAGIALLPDIGLFASTASRPASRTGYVLHRLNRFREAWIVSVIIGWLSFFTVLVALGGVFVILWAVSGGFMGFVGAMMACAIVVIAYAVTSAR